MTLVLINLLGHITCIAEPIKMPFGRLTLVGPRNHVLDGIKSLNRKEQFLGVVRPWKIMGSL